MSVDIILFKQGGGSTAIDLVEEMSDQTYEVLKRKAIRYMKASYEPPGAVELLEKYSFKIWQARNDFGDQFEVLYLRAEMELYIQIENEINGWGTLILDGVPRVAQAFEKIGHSLRFIAVGLNLEERVGSVPSPKLTITSDTVDEALRNAETLIGRHGAASALDRVHTAFHGYLEAACGKAGISVQPDASMTDIFARLRDQHPALKISDPEDKARMDQIFRGMARIVDALDPIRNRKTLAHPNPLLDEPEASLAVNLVRTMLHYLDRRLS